jgi:hypothetical protein
MKFKKPTIQQVKDYINFKNIGAYIDAETFYWHYEAKDWMIGKNKMKKWRAAVSGWASREKKKRPHKVERTCSFCDEKASGQYNAFWYCRKKSCYDRAHGREYAKT